MVARQPDVPEAPTSGLPLTAVPDQADPHERTQRIASLVGACVGMVGGTLYSAVLIENIKGSLDTWMGAIITIFLGLILGCALGYILGPNLSVRPYFWVEERLTTIPLSELVGVVAGVIVALAIAALITLIASGLPDGLGWVAGFAVAAVLVPMGMTVGHRRRQDISLMGIQMGAAGAAPTKVVVDTSAVIDGRLLDLARAGFCLYHLMIPQFVLAELQAVADSADPIRRSRGRRGLAMLEELRSLSGLELSFPQADYPSMPDVDAKLVRLAREEGAGVLTVDFNLDRVAQIAGIRVLNLNQLATALKPAMMAGERVDVDVVKEGREPDQGVGYLDDGTMLVVEGGRDHLGQRVAVVVRSVIQTTSGRMIFAQFEGPAEVEPVVRNPSRRAKASGNRS